MLLKGIAFAGLVRVALSLRLGDGWRIGGAAKAESRDAILPIRGGPIKEAGGGSLARGEKVSMSPVAWLIEFTVPGRLLGALLRRW